MKKLTLLILAFILILPVFAEEVPETWIPFDEEGSLFIKHDDLSDQYILVNKDGTMADQGQGFRAYEDDSFPIILCVEYNDLYGFVDTSGTWIAEPQFDFTNGFQDNGLAEVKKDGLWGLINLKGEYVFEPQFESYFYWDQYFIHFFNHVARVKKGGLFGYIRDDGTFLFEPQFEQAGFNKDRLKWLSEPHIPTGIIEDITWNHEEAVHMLSQIADRIGNEELWNFKSDITSDSQIYASHFSDDEGKDARVKEALCIKWRDRALIQIEKDRFIRVWSYGNSTAWKSLSWDEQQHLNELFARNDETESALWKQQALDVLTPIVNASDMIPCAEDLGAAFSALPQVLEQLNINSLCVIRWCRSWSEPGQPFIPFAQYREQSVATTSVHDSSTLRQWWTEEKDAVRAYLNLWNDGDKNPLFENATPIHAEDTFSPQVAQFLLQSAADCASAWYINPLQDYLFLDQNYYLENANDERINIPGTCNTFNWTYRMPVSIQELSKNETLISKIQGIAAKHQTLPGGNR